ncbi:MAG: hypothetical protein RIS52_69 [Pseudomonadota bacterium]|jgi:uncharacterized repeat protein (TIGR01451 family)
MRTDYQWSIRNVGLAKAIPLAIATASIAFAAPAMAAGTTAGSTISNTATATYEDPIGTPKSIDSNTVDLRVDELLDVTVVRVGAVDTPTAPGATNQVIAFTVTNNGNGSEAFKLTPNAALGGDQFDPTVATVVLDTNGNGVYDPGVDTVYTSGSNDPVLAPDASVTVFVLSNIPAGASDGNRGQINLTAAATTGTGTPGTSFAGLGQGGGDAVVGTTGADSVDNAFYLVQNATISFSKSQSVVDPFGGTKVVPGSIVTYTLVATISGTGTLTNVVIGDPVPIGTAFLTGTLTVQGTPASDPTDADPGEYISSPTPKINVRLGSVPAGETRTVTFKVRVN